MSNKRKLNPVSVALGTTFAISLAASPVVNAAGNPFSITDYESGYMVAEGKCGDMEKAKEEGKCGDMEKAKEEGKCGDMEKAKEEGKCGDKEKVKEEGKCGEGKCGDKK